MGYLHNRQEVPCRSHYRSSVRFCPSSALFITLQLLTPSSGAVPWSEHAHRTAGRHCRRGPPAGWLCGRCHLRSTATGCWLQRGCGGKAGSDGRSQSVPSACLRGEPPLPSGGKGTRGSWRTHRNRERSASHLGQKQPQLLCLQMQFLFRANRCSKRHAALQLLFCTASIHTAVLPYSIPKKTIYFKSVCYRGLLCSAQHHLQQHVPSNLPKCHHSVLKALLLDRKATTENCAFNQKGKIAAGNPWFTATRERRFWVLLAANSAAMEKWSQREPPKISQEKSKYFHTEAGVMWNSVTVQSQNKDRIKEAIIGRDRSYTIG